MKNEMNTITPKEKALELFYWYENLLDPFIDNIKSSFAQSKIKQCALICVDEILKAGSADIVIQYFDDRYWNKVKEELRSI